MIFRVASDNFPNLEGIDVANRRQGIRCSYLYTNWTSIDKVIIVVVVVVQTN